MSSRPRYLTTSQAPISTSAKWGQDKATAMIPCIGVQDVQYPEAGLGQVPCGQCAEAWPRANTETGRSGPLLKLTCRFTVYLNPGVFRANPVLLLHVTNDGISKDSKEPMSGVHVCGLSSGPLYTPFLLNPLSCQ